MPAAKSEDGGMSLLGMAKAAMPWPTGEPVLGDGFVVIPVEARDALVELAGRVREWCASEGIETTGITVAVSSDDPAWAWARMVAALERLQR